MSFDVSALDGPPKPTDTPLRRVRRAVELCAQAGCGEDPWFRSGARHRGNGQPKILLPDTGKYTYLQRPSTLAKNFDTATENLQDWARRMGALGAALNPEKAKDLIDLDLSDKDGRQLANRIAIELANDEAEADEGMQYGNLTHALCEAYVKGLDVWQFFGPLDADQRAMFIAVVESFAEALRRHKIEVVATEVTVVNLKQGAAGNLDFYGQHKGSVKVCDIKTNDGAWLDRSFLSFILQTWLYATAESMYDPFSEQFIDMPGPVDQDEALIFHTDWRTWHETGHVDTVVYRLPIGTVGPHAFDLAKQVEELKKTAASSVSAVEADLEDLLRMSVEQVEVERAGLRADASAGDTGRASDAGGGVRLDRAAAGQGGPDEGSELAIPVSSDLGPGVGSGTDGGRGLLRPQADEGLVGGSTTGAVGPLIANFPACQSLVDNDRPCEKTGVFIVRGLPDHPWSGFHCLEHAERSSKLYDHQGGCIVEAIDGSMSPLSVTSKDNIATAITATQLRDRMQDAAGAAEQLIAAFPGSQVVEVEPLPERPTAPPVVPSYRPRNGGLEDVLDYHRSRLFELIENGHGDVLGQAWVAAQLPDITDDGCPTGSDFWAAVNAVLSAVEQQVGRTVDEVEWSKLQELANALPQNKQAELMGLWQMTGWSTANLPTRARADLLTFWLHEVSGR